jgi:integrase
LKGARFPEGRSWLEADISIWQSFKNGGTPPIENPAEHVDAIRDHAKEGRRPFTIGELQAVMAVADPEWRSLIRFGLYTGQRLADLSLLTWENVDLARNEIRLVTKKTGKRLTVPMSAPLHQHVLSLPGRRVPRHADSPQGI